jgi:hypothetical protein
MTTRHATLCLRFIKDVMAYEVLRMRLQVWTFARYIVVTSHSGSCPWLTARHS